MFAILCRSIDSISLGLSESFHLGSLDFLSGLQMVMVYLRMTFWLRVICCVRNIVVLPSGVVLRINVAITPYYGFL